MLWLALLAGCTELPQLPDCAGVSAPSGTAVVEWTDDGGVLVSGTASQGDALAVRSVRVGDFEAVPETFNYETWMLELDAESASELINDDGDFVAPVVATNACGQEATVASLALAEETGPELDLQTLDMEVVVPGGERYLPSDGSVSATVTLVANVEAAGQGVTLSATLGVIAPLVTTLASDGEHAVATATYTPTGAGPALISASSGSVSTFRAIQNAGAPLIVPDYLNIEPGEALGLQVDANGGDLGSCSATGELGAQSGSADLKSAPGGRDTDGDGLWDLFITAPAGSQPGDSVTITCTDVHGQVATALVEVPDNQL